jgi:hypothetical protein
VVETNRELQSRQSDLGSALIAPRPLRFKICFLHEGKSQTAEGAEIAEKTKGSSEWTEIYRIPATNPTNNTADSNRAATL